MSILTMTVAYRKEVTVLQAQHMWIGNEGVLIDLVWIMSRNTTLGGEGKLRYAVTGDFWISDISICLSLFCIIM